MKEETAENKVVITEKFIDLEKVIASKNPKLLKRIPDFVLRYLKHIIHVDEVNDFIYRHRNDFGFDFVDAIIKDFKVDVEIHGLENIPKTGKQFVVSNHPLGGLDGIALIWACKKVRQDIKFPVNDILMNIPQLKSLLIPINKHGKNADNIRILEDNFAAEQLLLYYPAGLVSRKQKGGVIKDLEWKHTVVNKARQHERDVIPAYMEATNSNFFYNLSRIRTKLGIKANIEMLYLVHEVYKFAKKGKGIKIYFDQALPYDYFDRSKKPKEWAAELKEMVYEIPKKYK
jgi:putative hemolysin